MVIEAAGCLKTYEKTSAGHECTTLVMDKCVQTGSLHFICNNLIMYQEVQTHTAQIQTEIFPSILDRPHAAPVVRGLFYLDQTPPQVLAKMTTSVSREAQSFWKVMKVHAIVLLSFYFDNGKHDDDGTKVMLYLCTTGNAQLLRSACGPPSGSPLPPPDKPYPFTPHNIISASKPAVSLSLAPHFFPIPLKAVE